MEIFDFSYDTRRFTLCDEPVRDLAGARTLVLRPFHPDIAAKILDFFVSAHFLEQLCVTPTTGSGLREVYESMFEPVAAAGGVVIDGSGKALAITRHGKLDLPKGKIEAGEDTETAALREVMEETGLESLSIIRPLITTRHIYEMEGKWLLKHTHWFLMQGNGAERLCPQREEGITAAEWLPVEELRLRAKDTYCTIQDVVAEATKG